jgi:hypothetical protein
VMDEPSHTVRERAFDATTPPRHLLHIFAPGQSLAVRDDGFTAIRHATPTVGAGGSVPLLRARRRTRGAGRVARRPSRPATGPARRRGPSGSEFSKVPGSEPRPLQLSSLERVGARPAAEAAERGMSGTAIPGAGPRAVRARIAALMSVVVSGGPRPRAPLAPPASRVREER